MIYTKGEVLEMFKPIVDANDDIQEFVSTRSEELPQDLLPLLSRLDWAIINCGEKND